MNETLLFGLVSVEKAATATWKEIGFLFKKKVLVLLSYKLDSAS